ncbi:ATPase inhibitor mai-2-like protein [Dinothrombium tinctorium]|uniref:ATP synthase F1 subunit epsilon n=1 Tax=Dinothrombium tinctorium TaxID=1965070 RepID=A0A3S3P0L8_9ACAR|nr:ATPase inhibitor mai-2-like protein [Dinothrombium tinctorium]RWS09537.1 ATPase inhibitor mai-2-like protein [Dinothrombium tinctorium]
MTSEWGSGSGKGGGTGGAIREAGGAFGKMETAHEEEYFRRKQREQLEAMKKHLHDEIDRHKMLIKEHEDAIRESKKKIEELTKN